jgi:hypothetical protein
MILIHTQDIYIVACLPISANDFDCLLELPEPEFEQKGISFFSTPIVAVKNC